MRSLMLYLPKSHSVFLHIPKTGGMWVRQVLTRLGICRKMAGYHRDLAHARNVWDDDIKCFTFVRHPADWLRSYWIDRLRAGWGGDTAIGRMCGAATFEEFTAKYLRLLPGYITEYFRHFCGAEDDPNPPLVRLHRNLRQGLIEMLEILGEDFDRDVILTEPIVNAAPDEIKRSCVYPDGVYEAICEAERSIIKQFYT